MGIGLDPDELPAIVMYDEKAQHRLERNRAQTLITAGEWLKYFIPAPTRFPS